MKFATAFSIAMLYGSVCAALEAAQDLHERDVESPELAARTGSICSIGIGRVAGTINWDATIYNVPQAERQTVNIVGTATFVSMDKGQSMTITGPPDVTVTNIDNAPVYTYNIPELQAPISDPDNGFTKVELHFSSGNTNWTIDDCGAGNVIFSAGRESWTCDFAC